MSIQQRDFLQRQIEQLAAMVASCLGGNADVTTIEVEKECDRVKATLLGPLRDGFDRLTPDTAVMLLGVGPARELARVLALEADVHAHRGDEKSAAATRRRVQALLDAVEKARAGKASARR